jgi:hypothetical protein
MNIGIEKVDLQVVVESPWTIFSDNAEDQKFTIACQKHTEPQKHSLKWDLISNLAETTQVIWKITLEPPP